MTRKDSFHPLPEAETRMHPLARVTAFLSEADRLSAEGLLGRITDILAPDSFTLVGGSSTRHHLAVNGVALKRPFTDADICVPKPTTILPLLDHGFRVAHNHVLQKPEPGIPEFILKLVDPTTQTKLDVMPLDTNRFTEQVSFDGRPITISTAADHLTQAWGEIQRARLGLKVARKQLLDAELLLDITDPKKAAAVWDRRFGEQFGYSLPTAVTTGRNLQESHPELFVDKPFKGQPVADCEKCIHVPEIPIATREELVLALQK